MSSGNFFDEFGSIYDLVQAYKDKGLDVTFYGGFSNAEILYWNPDQRRIAGETVTTLAEAETFLEKCLQQHRTGQRYGSHRE